MICDFAFPFLVKPGERIPNPGLTKRELFAAMFCAAAIANPDVNVPVGLGYLGNTGESMDLFATNENPAAHGNAQAGHNQTNMGILS